jgi:hypothetical protein
MPRSSQESTPVLHSRMQIGLSCACFPTHAPAAHLSGSIDFGTRVSDARKEVGIGRFRTGVSVVTQEVNRADDQTLIATRVSFPFPEIA